MNIDRATQFAPMIAALPKMLAARQASDQAANALEQQQTKVDALARQMHALEIKIQPYQGATPADFVAYGTVAGQFYAEYAKLAPLRATSDAAYAEFTSEWTSAKALYFALLDNPGAVENTGGMQLV